jgi:hypothetical protein
VPSRPRRVRGTTFGKNSEDIHGPGRALRICASVPRESRRYELLQRARRRRSRHARRESREVICSFAGTRARAKSCPLASDRKMQTHCERYSGWRRSPRIPISWSATIILAVVPGRS